MKKILALTFGGVLVFGFVLALFPNRVNAQQFENNACGGANLTLEEGSCTEGKKGGDFNDEQKLNNLIKNIVNIFTVIVGIVAVIMIIYGGFRYITSGGDSGAITSARNTIIYALVGLIIVALAQVIVRFVLNTATTK